MSAGVELDQVPFGTGLETTALLPTQSTAGATIGALAGD